MKCSNNVIILIIVGVLSLAACSSTSMMGSWSSPDFDRKIGSVYIIGIAKNDLNRRIFEDTFNREFASYGIKAVSSYKDLPKSQDIDEEAIKQRTIATGTDSVILTQLVNQRKESVTSPGRISGYSSGPYYGGRGYYDRPNYYRSWGSYYNRRTDITIEPPTTTEFVVLTVESVLYDLKSGEMIWSGQLETVVDGNIEKMMQDYVKVVTEDLKSKGLI
ncbi:MAG: hypothetical protein JRE63_03045 [Deltaproteobacteria bacterium]|jgi:hypothetical protein|nr:hypothetical protein [Deltaproteobacteria bacterium]